MSKDVKCIALFVLGVTAIFFSHLAVSHAASLNCDAQLSSDLKINIPVVYFSGNYYQVDFQYAPSSDGLVWVKLTSATQTTQGDCETPATLSLISEKYVLHLPSLNFNGTEFWADFEYVPTADGLKLTNYGSVSTCTVKSGEDIQACIDRVLSSGGGKVFVSTGTYTISKYLHIGAGNLILKGEGAETIIYLADNAGTSNIVVGPITPMNPDEDSSSIPVKHVLIRDLSINGNKNNQATEAWASPYQYIMVSGITIRYAKDIRVSNVKVINGRSAGILVEKSTEGFLLDQVDIQASAYDGFSCNKSYNGIVTNSQFQQNTYAGITATCDCSKNIFSKNVISFNGLTDSVKAPGIYFAEAHLNEVKDNMIEGNSDVGLFLTGADCRVTNTGASMNNFDNNQIFSNQSCGVYLDNKNGGPGTGNKANSTIYHANGYDGVCNYNADLYNEINPIVK
jgi:parallel beta-helix repeat protein